MFRELTEQEQTEFRAWAVVNYEPGAEISEVWHPVVQEECVRINEGHAKRACGICGQDRGEFGHNARPLAAGRCCDECNARGVLPFRRYLATQDKE